MKQEFNILSLFDGMSCGQLALRRAGIKYDNYYASEVDKDAITITQKRFTNTIQLGDVTKVKGVDLPKIKLLLGGSPCVGFSTSGKGLNFEDPQSKLFFEFVRLLDECKPKYFLLENVKMKKEWENKISEYLRTRPIRINSALVSAQNRERLYWTNIPNVKKPIDRCIYLQDVLEDIDDSFYNAVPIDGEIARRLHIPDSKKQILLNINNSNTGMSGRVLSNLSKKSHALTASGSNWIKYGYIVFDKDNEPTTLMWRRLTVTEWERLQTVPVGYTGGLQVGNRCKLIGNGWTIDVISYILRKIKNGPIPKRRRDLGLFPTF